MPIMIVGKSKCPLCGEIMNGATDNLVGFSPFIANMNDPLFIFHDGIFHEECVKAHPLFPSLMKRYNDKRRISLKEKHCAYCHQGFTMEEVVKRNDFWGVPYISYANPELEKFDYIELHKHCMSKYEYIHELYDALCKINSEGWWGGPILKYECIGIIEASWKDPDNIPTIEYKYYGLKCVDVKYSYNNGEKKTPELDVDVKK